MIHKAIKTDLSPAERKREILDTVIGFALTLAAIYGVNLFSKTVFTTLPLGAKLVLMPVLTLAAALPTALILIIRRDRLSTLHIEKRTLIKQLLIGTALAVGLSIVLTLVPHLFDLHDWVGGSGKDQPLWYIAFHLFYAVFAVGLSEEFIFRCFLYEKPKRIVKSDLWTVVISSVLFGLFHCFTGGGIAQIVCTALIGAIFALARLKIKDCTIVSLIVMHGVYDWLIVVWANVF